MASKDGLYGRLLARAQAVQVLFQAESAGRPVRNVLDGEYVVTRGPIDPFGEGLALGVAEQADMLDRVIGLVASNWAISRLALVDKNILRLALYELLFEDEVSSSVAISEAVNLAKVFGGEDSYVFVNGVLGRVARDREAGVDFLARAAQQKADQEAAREAARAARAAALAAERAEEAGEGPAATEGEGPAAAEDEALAAAEDGAVAVADDVPLETQGFDPARAPEDAEAAEDSLEAVDTSAPAAPVAEAVVALSEEARS